MRAFRDAVAFAVIEWTRAGSLPRGWRGAYDGPQDFGKLLAFLTLVMTLALLGWSVQSDAILKIHQAVLGVVNMPEAPIPVTFGGSYENGYSFSLRTLDALDRELRQKKARALPLRTGSGDGSFRGIALPGFAAGGDNPDPSWVAGPEEPQLPIWALPTNSSLMRYYTAKRHRPIGDFQMAVILNEALFKRYFRFKPYLAAVGRLGAAVRGQPHLPSECAQAPCDPSRLKNIVLKASDGDNYYVFDVIWEENLQTPVPVAAIVPFGLVDLVDYGRYLQKKTPPELPPPLEGQGRIEARVTSVAFAPDADARADAVLHESLKRCATDEAGSVFTFFPPKDPKWVEDCIGRPLADIPESAELRLENYPVVRYCAPSVLIVKINRIDPRDVRTSELPWELQIGFNRRHALNEPPAVNLRGVGATLADTDDTHALRTAALAFCRPGEKELGDDETLFLAERLDTLVAEFPQNTQLPSRIDAILDKKDVQGRTLYRMTDEQRRSIARTGLLSTFQEWSGRAVGAAAFILFAMLIMTSIHALVDRRVRSYALLEMVGFSRPSIGLMILGQIVTTALLACAVAYASYRLIVAVINDWFARSPVYSEALHKLGYDDPQLFKPLAAFDLTMLLLGFVVVVVLVAMPIIVFRAFGIPSPWERWRKGTAEGRIKTGELIENLTRSS